MLEKIKKLGNIPLIIILVILVILAITLSIVKAQKNEKVNANAIMSDTTINDELNEEIQEEQNQEEEEIIDEEYEEEADKEQPEDIQLAENAKYFIRVNYGQNVVTIYTKDSKGEYTVPYKAMLCSTGTATPRSGTYTIPSSSSKSLRGVWGMMIGNVWAQYYTRIKGSILFHSVPYLTKEKNNLEYWEYDKLGTSASAGCIRLTVEDAKWIYNNCPAGTKVEFYTDSNPGPLGKPTAQKISEHEEVRGWDPTDPDENNPWKLYNQNKEENEENKQKPTLSTPTKPTKPTTPTTPTISNKPDSEVQNPTQGDNTQTDTPDFNDGTTSEENKTPPVEEEPKQEEPEIPEQNEENTTDKEPDTPSEGNDDIPEQNGGEETEAA